ncbi:MAG TPA: isoprenylcysteine carboxylmethyltransferase family protein [Terriglobales bacterium]|nr:isoprenylcysteine carboxylmethyltransferase family protein [Terriglobales bacterium]
MRATLFEFRFRAFLIGMCFWLAFTLYSVDHLNFVAWLFLLSGRYKTAAQIPDSLAIHASFAAAAAVIALGALLRSWGTAYLSVQVMADKKVHSERLVADGPYRYVRNPLYLGNLLLAVGMGAMASRTGFFVLLLGMLFVVLRLIGREEAELLAGQGESYRAYLAAVPRLLPALRPRVPAAGARPDWLEGLFGETMIWVMALSVAAFAVTLKLPWFFVLLGSSFVLQVIAGVALKRRRAKAALSS